MASTYETQHATVVDLIAVGEIGGLVNGLASVYLNGTALLSESSAGLLGNSGTASVTGTTVTASSNIFGSVDLSDGKRFLQIQGASAAASTLSTAAAAGAVFINTSGSMFLAKHATNPQTGNPATIFSSAKYSIRIAGAGINGTDYVGIITNYDSATRVTVYPQIATAVAVGTSVEIDEVIQIASITNSNTAELTSNVPTNVTGKAIQLSAAEVQNEYNVFNTDTTNMAYDNTSANVYNGGRAGIAHEDSVGSAQSASFLFPSGQKLQLVSGVTTGYGSGSQSPAAGALVSGAISLGQNTASEIDRIKVNIKFPAGLRHIGGEKGQDEKAFAEFQVVLKYKVTASSTEQAVLVHGRDYGGNNFLSNVTPWTNEGSGQGNYRATGIYSYKYPSGPRIQGGGNSGLITKQGNNPAFVASFDVDMRRYQPFHSWAIEVRRLSPENPKQYGFDEVMSLTAVIDSYECIIEDKFSYPTSAYSVVKYSAEDFQSSPSRSYHIYGKKIQVPNNYLTREELGTNEAKYTRNSSGIDSGSYVPWTGALRGDYSQSPTSVDFKKVYCNNPAWIFYDILVNKDYGLGEFIQPSDIDKFSLYQIARYCDELVPDGKGGLEPRFTCNVYLSTVTEAYKVIKDLASTFRGMLAWIDGQIVGVQDSPKEAVYTFTQGNIENGIFDYTYTGQRARINQINVTWNNPDEFFKKTVLTVEDTGNIVKQGKVISQDIVAFGCTSESQARRLASWHLETDTKETEIVSFTTGINASFLRPGDIINVQDKSAYNIEHSGRVASGSTTSSIELDRSVDFGPGSTVGTACKLNIMFSGAAVYLAQDTPASIGSGGSIPTYTRGAFLPEVRDASGTLLDLVNNPPTAAAAANYFDNAGNHIDVQFSDTSRIEVKDITNTGTSATTITVSGAFSQAPLQDSIWAITSDNEDSDDVKKFRIASLSEDGDGKYSIGATQYEETKFDEIDTAIPTYTTNYIPYTQASEAIPVPTGIFVEMTPSGIPSEAGSPASYNATISWTPPEYAFTEHYEISHDMIANGSSNLNMSIETVAKGATSFTIPNVQAGNYTVKIRIVNTLGAKSPWGIKHTQVSAPLISDASLLGVARGGRLSVPFNFSADTGQFRVNSTNFTFSPPFSNEVTFSSATTAQRTELFATMSTSDVIYLYFDHSDTANPWKSLVVHTDTVVEDSDDNALNYKYYKLFGSTTGFNSTSGTVSTVAGSTTLTGSGTSFTDLVVGQLIKVSANASATTQVANSEYRIIDTIESDTSLTTSRAFTKTNTNIYLYNPSFIPDTGSDCIFGFVTKTGSVFSLALFGSSVASGGYSVVLTKDSHTFSSNPSGAVSSVAGADFSVKVLNGDTRYYLDTSASPADNTYSIGTITQSPSSGITFSSTTIGSSPFVDSLIDVTAVSSSNNAGTITVPIVINNGGPTFERTYSYAKAVDGVSGDPGLRTIQGYLYFEKTTAGAPSAPSGNTYTISTGLISGSGVNDSGTTNVWRNVPRTQDATSSNTFYTIRYYGEEAVANSTVIVVDYSTVVQHTSFTGVVTFSGGTTLTDGTNSKTPLEADDVGASGSTIIDGARITTGSIASSNFSGTGNGSAFSTAGTKINLNNGSIASKNFRVSSDGSAAFSGTLSIGGSTLTASNTFNSNTTQTDVGLGNVNNTSDAQVLSSAANNANSASKSAGSVGGWTIDSNSIFSGTKDTSGFSTSGITLSSAGSIHAKQFYIDTNGNAFFSGSLTIGAVTGAGGATASSVSAAQSTADTGVANAATAQARANVGVANAATAQARADVGVSNAATAQARANVGVANAATAQARADLGVSNAAAAQARADLGVSNAAAANTAAVNANNNANAKLAATEVTQAFLQGKITNASNFRSHVAAYAASNPSGFTTFAASDVQAVLDAGTTVISGSRITTGTINAANVSVTGLNASNISTGTLSASRINLGSTSFEASAGGQLVIKTGGVVTSNIGANAITNVTTDTSDNQGGTGNSSYFAYRDVGLSISVAKISGSDLLISGSFEIIPYNDQTMFRYRLLKGSTVIKTWGDNTGLFSSSTHGFGMPFGSPVQVAFDHIESSSGSGTNTYKIQCAVRDESFKVYNATIYALELKR